MKIKRPNRGFTLIEVMIVIAIISITLAIAIPTYQSYTRRAYYKEVILAAEPYKVAVSLCYARLNSLTGCDAGSNQIPANMTTASGAVRRIRINNGIITVTPVASKGIVATDTYILTPTASGGQLTWTASGGGVTNGYSQ